MYTPLKLTSGLLNQQGCLRTCSPEMSLILIDSALKEYDRGQSHHHATDVPAARDGQAWFCLAEGQLGLGDSTNSKNDDYYSTNPQDICFQLESNSWKCKLMTLTARSRAKQRRLDVADLLRALPDLTRGLQRLYVCHHLFALLNQMATALSLILRGTSCL